jgi:transposase InsO family protein
MAVIVDRGHPETIFSDNGTNLVATEKELREGLANLNSSLVTEEMINRGIDWKLSPPGGSHFGGSYERLVGSCKRALLAVLGGRAVSDEVFLTVFKEIANILNGRPITRVSTDPTEEGPLTPNHFILGCHHPTAPPDAETAFDGLSRHHWKQAQFIIDQWWRKWMREYVPELIPREILQQHTRQMRVGDEVLVIDENNRRGHWPRGFGTKTFPGDGGVIRRVAVKIGRSELIRPVIKLVKV